MPFAIGLYLAIYLNATIMIGGAVRMLMDGRKNVDEKTKERQSTDGTLYCRQSAHQSAVFSALHQAGSLSSDPVRYLLQLQLRYR